MVGKERLDFYGDGGRPTEMSLTELLAAVRDHKLNVRSLRQEVVDGGFQSVETMRSLAGAIEAATEILAECQRRGDIQFEARGDGEDKRYLSAEEVRDLALADLAKWQTILDTAETSKSLMGRVIPPWLLLPLAVESETDNRWKRKEVVRIFREGLGVDVGFGLKANIKILGLASRFCRRRQMGEDGLKQLLKAGLGNAWVRDELAGREFEAAFGRAATLTEMDIMDRLLKRHRNVVMAVNDLEKKGVGKGKKLVGKRETRRLAIQLILGVGVVAASPVAAVAAAHLLGGGKPEGTSGETPARTDLSRLEPPAPASEGDSNEVRGGEEEESDQEQSKPKDLFRDVWVPELLLWAAARQAEKQRVDPDFLSRVEPAFLPIDAENRSGRINVLLLGEGSDGMLTDVILVASFDAAANRVDLLSIPRDLYAPEVGKRVNAAFYLGDKNDGDGFLLTEKIVEDATGLPIHFGGYMKMEAMSSFIDAIGGIEIDVPARVEICVPERVPNCAIVEAGRQMFDGSSALAYARSRSGSDDFSRQRQQKEIFQAVLAKVKSDRKATAAFLGYLLFGVDQQVKSGNLQFDVDLAQVRGRIFGAGALSVIPAVEAQFRDGIEIGLPTMGRQLDMRSADVYETGRFETDQFLMTVKRATSLSRPMDYWQAVRKWVLGELGE